MKKLKRKLAAAINKAIGEPPNVGEVPNKGATKEVNLGHKTAKEKGDPEIPEDWDALEGPVLKVLFISFFTQ
ncbi:MAG: hypothetical protein C4320_00630 [Armatimonadota bacterium]